MTAIASLGFHHEHGWAPTCDGSLLGLDLVVYEPVRYACKITGAKAFWRPDGRALCVFEGIYGVEFISEQCARECLRGFMLTPAKQATVIRACDPVWTTRRYSNNRWFIRQQVEFIGKHLADKCGMCGGTEGRAKEDFDFHGKRVVVCSDECAELLSKRRVKQCRLEYRRMDRREKELHQLAKCRAQMVALRRYLRTNNPDHLRSLPEGFGPEATSPE